MKLHEFQIDSLQALMREPTNRYIIAHEQGLGKTPIAIHALKAHMDPGDQSLVVTPALVRPNWIVEFSKWWPTHPEIGVIKFGERKSLTKAQREELIAVHQAGIQVVSPELLHTVMQVGWRMIVVDELHYYKNDKSERSKVLKQIIEANPRAFILGLTGTMMPNDVGDIWNPIDLLWPGRVGTKWKFRSRYQNMEQILINDRTGETATKFVGLNELHADELALRLRSMCSRTTRVEVAHLLPTFDIHIVRFDVEAGRLRGNEVEDQLHVLADLKIEKITEWVIDATEKTSHVACVAHHKEITADLAREIQAQGGNVFHVDGDIPVEERIQIIEAAKSASQAVLVGTIQSLGIGIDLTRFCIAIAAELHWSPGVMEQLLLRFSRLSGTVPSAFYFSVVPGTIDEVIATRLETKFAAINPTIKPGEVGQRMSGLMEINEEEWLENITTAAAELEEDGYS